MSSQLFGTGTWIKIRMVEMQRAVYVYVCQNVHNDIETIIWTSYTVYNCQINGRWCEKYISFECTFFLYSLFFPTRSVAGTCWRFNNSKSNRKSFDVCWERRDCVCVQFKHMTCLEWDSWTYSQWIIIPYHVPFETVISCGCILSGRWYIEVHSFWSNWQANDLKMDDPSQNKDSGKKWSPTASTVTAIIRFC